MCVLRYDGTLLHRSMPTTFDQLKFPKFTGNSVIFQYIIDDTNVDVCNIFTFLSNLDDAKMLISNRYATMLLCWSEFDFGLTSVFCSVEGVSFFVRDVIASCGCADCLFLCNYLSQKNHLPQIVTLSVVIFAFIISQFECIVPSTEMVQLSYHNSFIENNKNDFWYR